MLRLPDLIELTAHGNDWHKYIGAVYAVFERDFVKNKSSFLNVEIKLRKHPMGRDGKEYTFWHLVSDGKTEDERLPDLERCKRIGWVKVIIDNAHEAEVKVWENERNGKKNICICYGEWEYMVVLGKRRTDKGKEYLLLLTAYCVEKNRKRQLEREYKNYQQLQKSPKS